MSIRKVLLYAGAAAGTLAFAALLYAAVSTVRDWLDYIQGQHDVNEIARCLVYHEKEGCLGLVGEDDVPVGERYYPEMLCPECDHLRCSAGDHDYIYSAQSPAGERLGHSLADNDTLIAWCSEPHHKGGRHVLQANLAGVHVADADNEISWYYQRRLRALTPEQVEDEIAYRTRIGLPPLSLE